MRQGTDFLLHILLLIGCLMVFASSCKKDNSYKVIAVSDIDGNVYRTVKIGSQIWTAENMRAFRFNDGTPIPLVTDNQEWEEMNSPACCRAGDDQTSFGGDYGLLYNWYVVEAGKLCPKGWHIPSSGEWDILTDYLGRNDAGNKLKTLSGWENDGNGTDNFGFSALPSGYRAEDGSFIYPGSEGCWWTSTNQDPEYVLVRSIIWHSGEIRKNRGTKNYGFSVRCVRNK